MVKAVHFSVSIAVGDWARYGIELPKRSYYGYYKICTDAYRDCENVLEY
jgi:hypothetical protein